MTDSEYFQIVYIQDGGVAKRVMVLGTVADLAREMERGDDVDYTVDEVFALNQVGDLVPLVWEVRGGSWGGDDTALAQVTVWHPDGRREQASYTIDGRA